jgi:uncharacterized protein involved in response to NO
MRPDRQMSASPTKEETRTATAFLGGGFRVFFFGAAAWAIVAIGLWVPLYLGKLRLPTRFDPLSWHIHEMLFGFVLAAIGGFLLTAIPNWTKRPPITGWPLGLLGALWLLGRIACLVSAALPDPLAIAADLSYPLALLGVTAHEIAAGRNWRNLPLTVPVGVFLVADLLMHLERTAMPELGGLGWRLGVAASIQLISVVGGRIIPSFTRNWLVKRGVSALPTVHGPVDVLAIGFLHAGLLGWAFLPGSVIVGVVLLVGALLNAWRLARWRGGATVREPLLFILHVGYGWVIAGATLLALSMLDEAIPIAAAIHALSVGAMGTMILAVMSRASRGHTGHALTADRATVGLYLLVTVAALVRLAAAWGGPGAASLVALSGALWIAAFLLFEAAYGPMLLTRRSGEK